MDFKKEITTYLEHEIETLRALDTDAINAALNLLLEAFEKGSTIYVFGNGGSSSTASHYQNDFNKGVSEHTEKKFNFLCLNDNVATVMAVANDIGFEEVFRFQLQGHLKPGDLVMAISGSGNSKNVLNAVEYARNCGNKVIGLTGFGGGRLREMSDVCLHVPINSMQITKSVNSEPAEGKKSSDTMGTKHFVEFGLYRVKGSINVQLAEKTGFSEEDLELLWQAILNMFEHDHSAARGKMAVRELIVFKHDTELGCAPAYKLFESVTIRRKKPDESAPARSYQDYVVEVNESALPAGITCTRMG